MNLHVYYYTVCEGGHILETSREVSKEYLDNLDLGYDKIIMPDGFTFYSIGGAGWRWDSKNGFTSMSDMIGKEEGDVMKEYQEGDDCPKCLGSMGYERVDNCSCHINPPCGACVENPLVCLKCGFNPEEDSDED